jgi:hypothetical protein
VILISLPGGAGGGSFRFARSVSVSCRRFHTFPTSPARANKQVSEPVSQTSKHVVAVSCCLVGAEVTRISRREFNSGETLDGKSGWSRREDRRGRGGHRFSTITFPSCDALKFHGATDIAIPRSVPAACICRANSGIISQHGLFRNTCVPVKSNNSRNSLSAYPGLMWNFPNSNVAFLITTRHSRA